MNSDELGTKGEAKFADLCSDATIQANKVDIDRAGWDFVLHFPLSPDEVVSLDAREEHGTAFAQVKAIWRSPKPKITLRLSSAEKLAKQTSPAYIAALAFNKNDLSDFDLYMIELSGVPLAKILTALRKQDKAGRRAVNNVNISLSLSNAYRLNPPTGGAILDVLASAIAHGPSNYTSSKIAELKTIGFPEKPMRGEGQIKVNTDEFLNTLLGDKPLGVSFTDIFETRFGIELPIPVEPGNITQFDFSPAARTCRLHVTSDFLPRTMLFDGVLTHAGLPGLHGSLWKTRLDFGPFIFEFPEFHTRWRPKFATEGDHIFSAKILRDFYLLCKAKTFGTTSYRVTIEGSETEHRWNLPRWDDPHSRELENRFLLFEALTQIEQLTGADFSRISSREVFQSFHAIMYAWGFGAVDRGFRMTFKSENSERRSGEIIIGGIVDIARERLAYCAKAKIFPYADDGPHWWRTESIKPLTIERITKKPSDFRSIIDEQKKRCGIEEALFLGENRQFYNEAYNDLGKF